MPSILHRGNGNFSAICSPLRYRKSRTPRKSVLPQHRPAVFYLIRKYQNSSRTGAGIGDAEQKCFCIEDISGKILHLLTLQRLPPSWLPVPWIADFYAFIIGGVFTVKLYIYSSFCVIYTVLAGLHTLFPLSAFCVSHSRTDILLCCSSPLLFCCVSTAFLRFGLWFGHLAVAVMLFRAVFHLMSWHPFGLMYLLRSPPFVLLFLFPQINSPPHPPVLCLFPCHSAVIPRFCAGSAFPRSSGRALRFVSTITAIH